MGFNLGNALKNLGQKIESSAKDTGHKINASVQKTNTAVSTSVQKTNTAVANSNNTIRNEFKKPEVIKGLQSATKIGLGVFEAGMGFLPGGSLVNKAINTSLGASNGASHGQVNAWTGVSETNSTLNMLPGGLLSQNIAGVATNGKSNQEMNRFVPDPKKMLINDAKTIGKAVVTNPSSTLSVAKTVGQQNVQTVKQPLTSVLRAIAIPTPASTIAKVTPPLFKPSLMAQILPPSALPSLQPLNTISKGISSLPGPRIPTFSSLPVPHTTLMKTVDKPVVAIQPVEVKPSIIESLVAVSVEATPPLPPTSTLTANTQRTVSTPVTTLATVEPPSFFAMLLAWIFGKV